MMYLQGRIPEAVQMIARVPDRLLGWGVLYDSARYASATKDTANAARLLDLAIDRRPTTIIAMLSEPDFSDEQVLASTITRKTRALRASLTTEFDRTVRDLEGLRSLMNRSGCPTQWSDQFAARLGNSSSFQTSIRQADYLGGIRIRNRLAALRIEVPGSAKSAAEAYRETVRLRLGSIENKIAETDRQGRRATAEVRSRQSDELSKAGRIEGTAYISPKQQRLYNWVGGIVSWIVFGFFAQSYPARSAMSMPLSESVLLLSLVFGGWYPIGRLLAWNMKSSAQSRAARATSDANTRAGAETSSIEADMIGAISELRNSAAELKQQLLAVEQTISQISG
jgi:hypothetical protein